MMILNEILRMHKYEEGYEAVFNRDYSNPILDNIYNPRKDEKLGHKPDYKQFFGLKINLD